MDSKYGLGESLHVENNVVIELYSKQAGVKEGMQINGPLLIPPAKFGPWKVFAEDLGDLSTCSLRKITTVILGPCQDNVTMDSKG